MGLTIGTLPIGTKNSITDAPGVMVGHSTIIKGEGKLKPGYGPIRTGITVIFPHDRNLFREKVQARVTIINGFGKSIGLPQIQELGEIETPILITNTLNVPRVADALIDYMIEQNPEIGIKTGTVNPIVTECNDSFLNDIQGRHVRKENVLKAFHNAKNDTLLEGNVGAGTGMSCFGYKGGIGTSSRQVGTKVLGCLVVSNFGKKEDLTILGVPVGHLLTKKSANCVSSSNGSIIIILATNAPLNSQQLGRLGKRVPFGLARVGSHGSHGSGDFVIAFSTSSNERNKSLSNQSLNPFFRATIEAVEEAVLNSLFKAETMIGRDNNIREGIPIKEVMSLLQERKCLDS
ncbi:MAG: P1 family peptidase [Candidatus Hermodarchaeota archaeon]